MRNWATFTIGLLTALFLLLSVSALLLLRSHQDNLRQSSYDVTGMAALQLRMHFELLMGTLAAWEANTADADAEEAVLAFDILYERLESLPTRPTYDRILDEETLGIQAKMLEALSAEIPYIDRVAEGDESALAGVRARLIPLRVGFERLGHRPVQVASEARSETTREFERTSDWFLIVISGFIVSGLFFVVIISRQLVKLRKMTEGLRIARDNAEAASLAKSDFLSHMSHELRTPMNAILGFAQLLAMGKLDQKQAVAVEHISNSGHLLLSLIDQILELNKIIAGKIQVNPQEVIPGDLLQNCVALVQNQALEGNVILHKAELIGSLPHIVTDPMRVQQVLLNLLSNAIKYNHTGGEVFASCALLDDDRIVFTIRDTGKGIALERQHEMFEPFNRLGREAGTIEGTGIGLTITRELLNHLNGSIRFESTPDVGTTFWIELPVVWEKSSENQSQSLAGLALPTGG